MFGFGADKNGLYTVNDSSISAYSSNELFSSFEDYPEKLSQAIDWLATLGVKIPNQSRHRIYLKKLMIHVSSGVSLKEALNNDQELSKVIFETYELVRIYRNFKGKEPDGLKEKLVKFVNGPNFYDAELPQNSGNKPRNYGVEISVGSEMTMLGLNVSYGRGDFPEPLVYTQAGNVAIECKRPYTTRPEKIRKIFKEGASKALSYDKNEFSIVSRILVIDLTRYINPKCEPFRPESGMSQLGSFGSRIERVKETISSAYSEEKYKDLEAIIFRATYSIIYPNNNNYLSWYSRPLCVPLTDKTVFLDELYERYQHLSYIRNNSSGSTLKDSRSIPQDSCNLTLR